QVGIALVRGKARPQQPARQGAEVRQGRQVTLEDMDASRVARPDGEQPHRSASMAKRGIAGCTDARGLQLLTVSPVLPAGDPRLDPGALGGACAQVTR